MPSEVKKAKTMNRVALEKTLNEFLTLDQDELKSRLKDPKITMLELAVGNIVMRAATDSDQIRLNFLLDRLLGKVKEQVQVEVAHKPTIIVGIAGEPDIVLGMEQQKLMEGDE